MEHGAILEPPLKPGRSAILYHRAKKLLSEKTDGRSYMLPNGLQLEESIEATKQELIAHTHPRLWSGTWVVSASTGTLAAGVAQGLREIAPDAKLIVHLGFSRSIERLQKKVGPCEVIDEGYSYKDKVDVPCPFPSNPYYDLKAWKWLTENVHTLAQPVVFWNIGE